MDGMEKAAKPVLLHINLVGEGYKEPTAKTPHHRRGHEETRRSCAGELLPRCLYDLLQSPPSHEVKITTINHIKAKIVRLYAARLRHGNIELQDTDALQTKDDPLPTDKMSEEEGTVQDYLRARPSLWNADYDDEGLSECIQHLPATQI
jgi:hypothetical protein